MALMPSVLSVTHFFSVYLQAADSRDSLSMALYSQCFSWLINKINTKIKGKENFKSVGILDIFGFENFQVRILVFVGWVGFGDVGAYRKKFWWVCILLKDSIGHSEVSPLPLSPESRTIYLAAHFCQPYSYRLMFKVWFVTQTLSRSAVIADTEFLICMRTKYPNPTCTLFVYICFALCGESCMECF